MQKGTKLITRGGLWRNETHSGVSSSTKWPRSLGMMLIVTKKILRGANEKEILIKAEIN